MTRYRAMMLGLGIACLTLGALIGWDLWEPARIAPAESASVVVQSPAQSEATAAPSLRLEPVKRYDAIAERPLFSPTRKPTRPPPPPRNDVRRPTLTGILLNGVVIGPADKIALMTSSKSPKPLSLIEGETLEGWKLEKVMTDRVVLSAGDETAEISIWDKMTAAAAARKPSAR